MDLKLSIKLQLLKLRLEKLYDSFVFDILVCSCKKCDGKEIVRTAKRESIRNVDTTGSSMVNQ